jgi:prepilin-type N-terminal cleavage/methylation domain-containing protein
MPIATRTQQGFSLVELAIVMLIMGLVLGGLAMPLSVQRENARIRDVQTQLEVVEEALEGFALVNGFLPCPATPASNGYAAPSGGGCGAQHGFVPATTLNIDGARNGDNLLLDPWGSPLRYSISAADVDADGSWDFVTPGAMQAITIPALQPDLVVCATAAGSSPTSCASANVTLADQSPLIVYSLGKDWNSFSSPDQLENVGAALGGGATGTNYPVAADNVFVARVRNEAGGAEYDDQLRWLSANSRYRSLIEAGRLP